MSPQAWSPKAVADAGEQLYLEKYKAEYEQKYHGKFVAIDVNSGEATIADSPDQALEQAKAAHPDGIFHLIRVGFKSAFEIGFTYQNASSDWLFR